MNRRNLLIILVFTASRLVMNIMFRLPYAFLPVLALGMGIDTRVFSTALGARSFASASAPFLAILSDRRGRKFGLLLGSSVFLAGMALVTVMPVFPAFVITLLFTSIGRAAFDPAMQAYIGDRIPYAIRSRAIGFTEFGWSLSILVGIPLMGLAIRRWGWPAPFPILLFLGSLSFVALLTLVPSDRDGSRQVSGVLSGFQKVFHARPALLILLSASLMGGANEVVNLVYAVWIDVSFGLQIAALSAASIAIGFAELGGESLVTLITDRLGKLRSVQIGILLNCLAVMSLPILGGSLPGVLVGLFLYFLTFEFGLVSLITLATELLPEARATLMAFTSSSFFVGRALLAFVAVPLFSWEGIWGTAIIAIVINLLAFAVLLRFRRQSAGVL